MLGLSTAIVKLANSMESSFPPSDPSQVNASGAMKNLRALQNLLTFVSIAPIVFRIQCSRR